MDMKIALAGNPNCGKTTLFNDLTGSNQYVGNWPGVTVEKKEGKLLAAIIDVLDDIALEIADMKADQEELYDGLDAVSDDLEDVEDAVFGEDDEDEEDEYEYEEPEEDEDCYATTCPTCEETIYFDESVLEDGEVICPNCGEKLEFDLNGLEDEEAPQDEE